MPSRFQTPPVLVTPMVLAIFGVAYCLFVYLGVGDAACITAGCSLYKSFGIAGISMWIFGIIAFVVLTLLMAAGFYILSLYLARLILISDCILLLLLATTSPCLSCLGVALLFGLIYFFLRQAEHQEDKGTSWLLFIWSLLFVSNLVLSAREMFPPDPFYGTADAPVHIYFSPSCEHCIEAMDRFNLPDGQVAYYATAHDADDVSVLIEVKQRLSNGGEMPATLKDVLTDSSARPPFTWNLENLLLKWELWRNKSTIFERSNGMVPYITLKGLPVLSSSFETTQGQSLTGIKAPRISSDESSNSNASNLPSLGDQIDLGNTDMDSLNLLGEKGVPLFSNSTSFENCSDESPENCN